jgi:hypothetical protein
MESLLLQVASTVRAEADWGALLCELVDGGEPATELGVAHAEWLLTRHQPVDLFRRCQRPGGRSLGSRG